MVVKNDNRDKWADHVKFWREQGASYLVVNQIQLIHGITRTATCSVVHL